MNTLSNLSAVPLSEFKSTYINGRNTSYEMMADRIRATLGAPLINVEIHNNQLFDNIAIASEMFTKFAGYTTEYLVFDASLYETGRGVRLDKLMSITPYLTARYDNPSYRLDRKESSQTTFTTITGSSGLSATLDNFIINDEITDPLEYSIKYTDENYDTQISKIYLTSKYQSGSALATFLELGLIHTSDQELGTTSVMTSGNRVILYFTPNVDGKISVGKHPFSEQLEPIEVTQRLTYIDGFDESLNTYRKVMDTFTFEEGSSSGINTLFTIEQALAQQTYFSYSMGNYGFDLVSWYVLKQWLDVRAKLLNTQYQFIFNPRSQYLTLIPEPDPGRTLFGLVGCHVEQSVRELMKEPWVYQYALALSKITLGRVRGKYGNTDLFGGGSLDTSMLAEGLDEKKTLEEQLYTGASAGFGDADPPQFFVG